MKSIACFLCALLPLAASGANPWLPVKDVSLKVVAGSILDFSALAPAAKAVTEPLVVNANGDFAYQGSPTVGRRFLMVSTGIDVATGSFPDHAGADEYVKQLRLHGYNMARLHFVDAILMEGQKLDLTFNPEQLDRFYYLLAAFKRAGIYYMLDGMTSDNAGFGNVAERWNSQKDAKRRVFYDPLMQDHWKKLVLKIMGTVNPYTGTTTLADPALAGVILVNEGGIPFVTRSGLPAEMQPPFVAFLKKKYLTTAALKAAWGGELKAGETLEAASVALAKANDPNGKRMADTQRFFFDLEKSTATWMTNHLRQAGYKGLVTGYDNWSSQAASASRGQFSWVDMHSYFAEPSNFVAAGSVMRQDSMLGSGLLYITDLAVSRYHGKAFSVSEYGQVFWNKYRRESALAVPAYAAFQNWGMIAQHAGGFTLGYDERGGRKDRIYPFMVGPDPVLRANETLAALLFLRGDVARAKHQLRLKLEDWYTFEGNGIYSSVAQDVRRLTMVQGVGIDWLGQANNYDVQMQPYSSGVKVYKPTTMLPTATATAPASLPAAGNEANITVEQMYGNRVTVLRKGGVLEPSARDNTAYGVFLTDTGELALDRNRRRLTVVTPKTEGAVFDVLETIQLNNVRIDAATGPALLTVSAMDGANLNASKRMLVVLATDARNTGMTFADPGADTTLKSLGTGPVLIQAVSLRVKLLNANAKTLKVFSNKLNGSRGDPIAVVQEAGGISFTLDTSKLSHGPTTYFEIATN